MRRLGLQPILLPESEVAEVIREARQEWLKLDEQKTAFEELVIRLGTRDKAKRTMTSRFRSMVREKYGGYLWLQVIIATGTIPTRMLELANSLLSSRALECGPKQRAEAPVSSSGLADRPVGIGAQHRVSMAKRQRQGAMKALKAVRAENERRSYSDRRDWMTDAEFAKLQDEAEWSWTKATRLSEQSGHAYKMDGKTYGTPQASNFAILMADYCGQMDIDAASGARLQARGR